MTTLPTRSFTTVVQTIASGIQGRVSSFVDFSVGSPLRAIAEAFAGASLWLQGLILQVLAASRLSTASGTDVDTFVNDFTVTRLGAQPATGLVTYSRFTASPTTPFVPVGATIKTADGTQSFSVYADPTNVAYSAILAGYTMPASVATLTIPVQAVLAGSGGNIQAGALTQMTSPIMGVDAVINPAGFTNGIDQESDAALKLRFQAFIASLSKGTTIAIQATLGALQSGLQVVVHENIDADGITVDPGMVTVFLDDGSGSPPAALIATANATLIGVRAAGIRASVYAASPLLANVQLTITTAPGYTHQIVVAQVVAALGAAINATGLENTLSYFSLGSVAFSVPGVTNVSGVTLNGVPMDLVPTFGQTIKAGTLVVS